MFKAPQYDYRKKVPRRYDRVQKRNYSDDRYHMNTNNGTIAFSYKGIAIQRIKGIYSVYKRIQIKGFPAWMLSNLSGIYNNGADLQRDLDLAFLECDAERHAQVRNRFRNIKCDKCSTISLFKPEYKIKVYRTERDIQGQEIEVDTGLRRYECEWCAARCRMEDVVYVDDTVMR